MMTLTTAVWRLTEKKAEPQKQPIDTYVEQVALL